MHVSQRIRLKEERNRPNMTAEILLAQIFAPYRLLALLDGNQASARLFGWRPLYRVSQPRERTVSTA